MLSTVGWFLMKTGMAVSASFVKSHGLPRGSDSIFIFKHFNKWSKATGQS